MTDNMNELVTMMASMFVFDRDDAVRKLQSAEQFKDMPDVISMNPSPNLVEALTRIKKLPYFKNDAAVSGAVHGSSRHEDAIARELTAEGFVSLKLKGSLEKKNREHWLEHPEECTAIPENCFVEQPFGTHESPDFLVRTGKDTLIAIEAKSVASGHHPQYNSGSVKPAYIYVFCAKKTNETTIYKGDAIISLEQERLIKEYIAERREMDRILNEKLAELDTNKRGISFYTRPMIIQSGGAEYTDYFGHKNRAADEYSALKWISEKTGCPMPESITPVERS